MRPLAGRARLLALPLAVLLALTGCLTGCLVVPSTPDDHDWNQAAVQAIEDTASEVASVRLVLRQQLRERLPGRYAVVSAVASEEAAAKAGDTLTTLQPPRSRRAAAARVTDALSRAGDLITDARIALVDGDRASYSRLADELQRVHARLERQRARLP